MDEVVTVILGLIAIWVPVYFYIRGGKRAASLVVAPCMLGLLYWMYGGDVWGWNLYLLILSLMSAPLLYITLSLVEKMGELKPRCEG